MRGPRARRCLWPPLRPARVCREHESVLVASPASSRSIVHEIREGMRCGYIGIDVHRDFCEVCVRDERGGESRRRVATRPAELEALAAELGGDDYVALEVSGPTNPIGPVRPHGSAL